LYQRLNFWNKGSKNKETILPVIRLVRVQTFAYINRLMFFPVGIISHKP